MLISLLAISLGAASVAWTETEYYGVCSELTGFPGLLQRNGLLQTGTCVTVPGGRLCNAGATCTVSGKTGTCKNSAKPGGTPICSCVPNVSQ